MPVIELTTIINAPVSRCFDLARSIDLHKLSTSGTDEEAIAGRTSGLIDEGEYVTWRARHFGVVQTLTSTITGFQYPSYFRDEMVKGAFAMISHDHFFEDAEGKTIMRDTFEFEAPGGFLGKIISRFVLKKYLRDLLLKRNDMIRSFAESERWKEILTY